MTVADLIVNEKADFNNLDSLSPPAGARSLLAEEHLASEDLALLASLEFLCVCARLRPALPQPAVQTPGSPAQAAAAVDFTLTSAKPSMSTW